MFNRFKFCLYCFLSSATTCVASEFPAEIAVKPFPTTLEMVRSDKPNAIIAMQKGNLHPEFAALIQKRMAAAWGITFPIRELSDHSDGSENLILFGASNSNMLLRELAANNFICEQTTDFELRVIPQVLDWQRGALYFGGKTTAQVEASIDHFLKRFPAAAPLPFSADLGIKTKYLHANDYYRLITKIYADKDRDAPARVTQGPVKGLTMAFRDTCDENYALVMGKAVSFMLKNYDSGKRSDRNRPQTFTFYMIPQFVFLVENSSAFNAKHRRDAAELMRRFMEDAMDFWEMTTPAKLYAKGQIEYLTNHYNFAARSVYNTARYLLDRHDYEPARYPQTIANHVFAGVQDHPISPEDAAGYHFLVYRIFLNHALASGKYDIDFFRNERYEQAVDYAKMLINHLGFTPGYGDAFAIKGIGPFPMLMDALDILNDRECEFLIDLIARNSGSKYHVRMADIIKMDSDIQPITNPKYLGMNALKLDDFLLSQYSRYPKYKRPVLNKAIFRSGWDETANFLALNGLTSAPHGHDDAAGICQYINGEHIWLFEGHYINRHAEDHNVLNVIRDGMAPDRRRYFKPSLNMAAQIAAEAQSDTRNFALLTLLLAQYNGINQYRRFAWESEGGFWVVDAAVATQLGNYTLINQFRSTGDVKDSPQGFVITQKKSDNPEVPHRFSISEGSGSSKSRYTKLETCHGRANTLLPGYRYSDQITKSLLQQHTQSMNKCDVAYFFNYLTPLSADATNVEIFKIAENAFLAVDGKFPRLAVIGALNLPQLTIKADACFIGPHGLLAERATEIMVGEHHFEIKSGETTAIDFRDDVERSAVQQTLTALAAELAKPTPNTPLPIIEVAERQFAQTLVFEHPVSAMAVDNQTIAVGLTDGSFKLLDLNGAIITERKFKERISAITRIEAGAKSRWMVGVDGKKMNSVKVVSSGKLFALDDAGNDLWSKVVPQFSERYGNVTTIFPALLDGQSADPSIIIGAESWLYQAYDLDGKQRWLTRCTHGACGGAAGDLTGDGKDEVFIGNEYYTHAIVDASGKLVAQTTTSPHDIDAHIFDLNGDGKLEIVVGRNDGYLYVEGVGDNPLSVKKLNVGGQPKNIVVLENNQQCRVAVATLTGVVTFIGPNLERVGYHVLPTALTAMAGQGALLYAVALDGCVYELDQDGIKAKLPFRYNPDALEPPRAVGNKDALAVSSDKSLYIL